MTVGHFNPGTCQVASFGFFFVVVAAVLFVLFLFLLYFYNLSLFFFPENTWITVF